MKGRCFDEVMPLRNLCYAVKLTMLNYLSYYDFNLLKKEWFIGVKIFPIIELKYLFLDCQVQVAVLF